MCNSAGMFDVNIFSWLLNFQQIAETLTATFVCQMCGLTWAAESTFSKLLKFFSNSLKLKNCFLCCETCSPHCFTDASVMCPSVEGMVAGEIFSEIISSQMGTSGWTILPHSCDVAPFGAWQQQHLWFKWMSCAILQAHTFDVNVFSELLKALSANCWNSDCSFCVPNVRTHVSCWKCFQQIAETFQQFAETEKSFLVLWDMFPALCRGCCSGTIESTRKQTSIGRQWLHCWWPAQCDGDAECSGSWPTRANLALHTSQLWATRNSCFCDIFNFVGEQLRAIAHEQKWEKRAKEESGAIAHNFWISTHWFTLNCQLVHEQEKKEQLTWEQLPKRKKSNQEKMEAFAKNSFHKKKISACPWHKQQVCGSFVEHLSQWRSMIFVNHVKWFCELTTAVFIIVKWFFVNHHVIFVKWTTSLMTTKFLGVLFTWLFSSHHWSRCCAIWALTLQRTMWNLPIAPRAVGKVPASAFCTLCTGIKHTQKHCGKWDCGALAGTWGHLQAQMFASTIFNGWQAHFECIHPILKEKWDKSLSSVRNQKCACGKMKNVFHKLHMQCLAKIVFVKSTALSIHSNATMRSVFQTFQWDCQIWPQQWNCITDAALVGCGTTQISWTWLWFCLLHFKQKFAAVSNWVLLKLAVLFSWITISVLCPTKDWEKSNDFPEMTHILWMFSLLKTVQTSVIHCSFCNVPCHEKWQTELTFHCDSFGVIKPLSTTASNQ